MIALPVAVTLISACCFGLTGPRIARLLPPREATWLISVGAVVSALSGAIVLALLGTILVGQMPGIAGVGHWSIATLRHHAPTEPGVGLASLLGVLAAGVAVVIVAARRATAVISAYRACKAMSGDGDLVVIDGAAPSAVAVPGRPGRVVVSSSLLRLLSAAERRVVLAHERAHLADGHHWHRSAVSIAIAANPLLAPLSPAITLATERWADERAASELGDRRDVARALARVAFLTRPSVQEEPQLAAGSQAVATRVSALLVNEPRHRPLLSLVAIAPLVAGLLATAIVEKRIEHAFELAGHAYQASRGF